MMRAGNLMLNRTIQVLVEGTEKKSHAKVDESLFRWRTERRTVFLWKP
jgi:hypothetical protein